MIWIIVLACLILVLMFQYQNMDTNNETMSLIRLLNKTINEDKAYVLEKVEQMTILNRHIRMNEQELHNLEKTVGAIQKQINLKPKVKKVEKKKRN